LPRSTGLRPGGLAAARRLGDAAVDGEVVKLQADHVVVGGHGELVELLGHADGDPLVAAAAQGARRAGAVGHALVATAEHQDLHELVEHDPVGDAGALAAQRVGVDVLGQQGVELVPDGVDDSRWQHRHGGVRVGASATGFSAPCLTCFHPPTAATS